MVTKYRIEEAEKTDSDDFGGNEIKEEERSDHNKMHTLLTSIGQQEYAPQSDLVFQRALSSRFLLQLAVNVSLCN